MNRIVIVLGENGELDGVISDVACRVLVLDKNCKDEPVYEMTEGIGKITGVHHVRAAIGDNLAATFESSGPWLETKPSFGEVK
jgi:hypothetical protein